MQITIFRTIAVVCLVIVLTLNGCVTHEVIEPVIKVPRFYSCRTQIDDLHIIADPYITRSKMRYLFGKDLRKKGLYPVHLIFNNMGNSVYDVTEISVTLLNGTGAVCSPLTYAQAMEHFVNNTALKMVSYGLIGSAFLILTVPFAVSAGVSSYRTNKVVKKDLIDKQLDANYVLPQQIKHGFLFFDISDGEHAVDIKEFSQQKRLVIKHIRIAPVKTYFDAEIILS